MKPDWPKISEEEVKRREAEAELRIIDALEKPKYDGMPALLKKTHRLTTKTRDPIVQGVINKMINRSEDGIEKYKNTMETAQKPLVGWIEDVQEELLDAVIYLEKLKIDSINLKKLL